MAKLTANLSVAPVWEMATAQPVRIRMRGRGGGGRGSPKLTDEDVRAIREVARAGMRCAFKLVMDRWGISKSYARAVMRGDTHPHVI